MASSSAPRGFTYLELIATAAILMILASAILPTAKVVRIRNKEIELRRELRSLRNAIDQYKLAVDRGRIGGTDIKLGSEGYPPDLETLVDGVSQVGKLDSKLKFLRQVPIDPMTGKAEWEMRCYQDDADDKSWCGDNVYDVHSRSGGTALDGSKYAEW
jgi:general secretion pathway protein G